MKRMKGYYFCDATLDHKRDIYENARQDCNVSKRYFIVLVTSNNFQIVTPNKEQIKVLMEAKKKTLIWTDYKLINQTTFYSEAWLQNKLF